MSQPLSKPLETETVVAILSNATCRSVLRVLRETEAATARELADRLASSNDDGVENSGYDARRDALVALVHHHLPRLAAHGLVEYDDPLDEIRLGSRFDEVERFVEPVEGPAAD